MINMKYIDSLNGRQFEIFTGNLLKDLGFHKIKVTKPSGDHGLDVLAEDVTGTSIGIQCKHLDSGEYTGYRAIEEAFTGEAFYNIDKSILLTNQRITNDAVRSTNKTKINVICWDRSDLKNLVTIANNLSVSHKANTRQQEIIQEEPTKHHSMYSRVFRSDYSLRDAKLLGILLSNIIKNNYPKHITMNLKHLIKLLGLSKNFEEATDQLFGICKNSDSFSFHSNKFLRGPIGTINLFMFRLIEKNNQVIFYDYSCLVDFLKGKPIDGVEKY